MRLETLPYPLIIEIIYSYFTEAVEEIKIEDEEMRQNWRFNNRLGYTLHLSVT